MMDAGAHVIGETDWLASDPVFYDAQTGIVSPRINDIIKSVASVKLHPEGLHNYLEFGYSILEQTPICGVRFLPPSSQIWRDVSGAIKIVNLPDPFEKYERYNLTESDTIDLIRERVQAWEARLPSDQEIVLPLSGGYDSRLLLWCLRDPSRVRAFTYGVSGNQRKSTEVVHAEELAKKFGIRWEHIPLGDFHNYFDDWDSEFGISTHAHGMYQFEFYSKIRSRLSGRHALLSGIIGDVWAGTVPPSQLSHAGNLGRLSFAHGLNADPECVRFSANYELREKFWHENKDQLVSYPFQVVTSMRFKLMLLSYLIRVPRLFDFEPWTPFLDIEVASSMLNLTPKRRKNRQWQRDFFAKVGLDLEASGLGGVSSNMLDIHGIRRVPLKPLDKCVLTEIFMPDYIDWINNSVEISFLKNFHINMFFTPKLGGVLRRLDIQPEILKAYSAYCCLKPIEKLLRK